jgi:ankyrin repeat protein
LAAALEAEPARIAAADAQRMTLLHRAVAAEQAVLVADLLSHPDLPLDAAQLSHARTALHIAAIKGNVTLINLLLEAGANVFATDAQGLLPLDVASGPAAISALNTPTLHPERILRQAVRKGAVTRVRRVLSACPRLLATIDADGRTPLHWAIGKGSLPMLEALIATGMSLDTPDRTGQTPLHETARRGEFALLSRLLSAGTAPAPADNQGLTPLHLTAGHGDATRTLAPPPVIDEAPDPCAETHEVVGQCTFDFDARPAVAAAPASRRTTPSSPLPGTPVVSRDDPSIAAALIAAGADINARARGGLTALHLAAAIGDVAITMLLLEHGAQVDFTLSLWQATPAHLAAAGGHDAIVTLLRHAGANEDARDSYGRRVSDLLAY